MGRLFALTIASLLIVAPADAGTRAVYDRPDKGTLTVEIADNGDVRVGPEDQTMYVLLIGNTSYVVSPKDGKPSVARLVDVAAAFDKVMPPMFGKLFGAAAEATKDIPARIETIGPETVNGRAGIAYRFKTGPDGEAQPAIVLSQDPALAPVGRAMGRFTEATMLLLAPLFGKATEAMVGDMRAILSLGTPLRGGDGMTLKSVESADIPAARVTLPAKPLTVDEIVRSMKLTPIT
jgi:hypothetical protein